MVSFDLGPFWREREGREKREREEIPTQLLYLYPYPLTSSHLHICTSAHLHTSPTPCQSLQKPTKQLKDYLSKLRFFSPFFHTIVRASTQQPRLYVGMVLILIFAEVLGLYGLIVCILMLTKSQENVTPCGGRLD